MSKSDYIIHLSIDIETYSSVDLRKAGLYKYVQAPDFQILLFAFSWDGEPVRVVDLAQGEEIPKHVLMALNDPYIIKHAYNASFEWYCLNKFWESPIDQWRCTMVHGLYCGYTAGLGPTGEALGLPQDKRKLGVGGALIRTFCLPTKPTKTNGNRTRTLPHHEPDKWRLFKEYCAGDVVAEMEILRRLNAFPVHVNEQWLWQLDQMINAYGVAVDRELIEAALAVDAQVTEELMAEAVKLSGLDNPKSVQQLTKWLTEELEEEVDNLRKDTVSKLIDKVPEGDAKRVLEIRKELAKTSVKKYAAMQHAVCDDDRIRGLIQFYGANRTGRWCLAEGTPVLVKRANGVITEVPIQRVEIDDLVWDGDQWVSHEGVVFSGDKDVLTWDGVTATAEHLVFIDNNTKIPLGVAKERRIPLWRGNTPSTN